MKRLSNKNTINEQKIAIKFLKEKEISNTSKKKVIRINLSAMTRVTWSGDVEVPNNMSENDLDDMVRYFYDEIDGSEFTEDNEYWERGDCYHEQLTTSHKLAEFVLIRRKNR